MPELLTMQDLANGHLDVKALGEAANGDENTIVTTRTGNTYPSVKKAIKTLFENGGLPAKPFATKVLMTASALVDDKYAMVTDDTESANNGLYVKDGSVWTKSKYDPLSVANINTGWLISHYDSSIFDKSSNLFNAESCTIGQIIGEDGVVTQRSDYSTSDFIAVVPNQEYTISSSKQTGSPFVTTALFDAGMDFIARINTGTGSNPSTSLTIKIPDNVFFIKFNINSGLPTTGNRMFNVGDNALPYEPYYKHIKDNLTKSILVTEGEKW